MILGPLARGLLVGTLGSYPPFIFLLLVSVFLQFQNTLIDIAVRNPLATFGNLMSFRLGSSLDATIICGFRYIENATVLFNRTVAGFR